MTDNSASSNNQSNNQLAGQRAVIPVMVARKTGHILVAASLAGIIAIDPDPIYE